MRVRDELIARATACDDALLAMGAIADHSPDAESMGGMARDEQDEITTRLYDPLPPINPDISRKTETMSDIVERLRALNQSEFTCDPAIDEAADEIARLRAALAKITAGRYDGLEVTHYSAHDCRNIARAALIKTT
jgi:hypothetical protein